MSSSAAASIRSLSCLEPVPPPATDEKENRAPSQRIRRASGRSQLCSQSCLPSKREEVGKGGGSNDCHKMRMVGTSMVYPRSTISPSIQNNPATGLWIVTFHATTRGKGAQRAFSFQSEKEARAAAFANSPPVLIPFKNEPSCQLCDANFTLFKRPRHCRNCGIVICSKFSCVTHWPKRMIPETFNTKNQSRVSVCTSCDIMAKRFHHSLICGQLDTAKELFETTRNINLRTPFVHDKKRGEEREDLFPIHSSIISGNVKLLRWLVDDQHCPLHMAGHSGVNSGTSGGVLQSLSRRNSPHHVFTPTIKTSKGRSVIDIAAETKNMDILAYLVSEKSVSVFELNDKELALGALEAAILAGTALTSCAPTEGSKVLPHKVNCRKEIHEEELPMKMALSAAIRSPERTNIVNLATMPLPPIQNRRLVERDSHGGLYDRVRDEQSEDEEHANLSDEESLATVVPDTCVVCNRAEVNCIAMPCGHQLCCSTCSSPLVSCPHCHEQSYFVQIFHP